ncbi:hypothetical protein [Streptomyces sp. P5_D11]
MAALLAALSTDVLLPVIIAAMSMSMTTATVLWSPQMQMGMDVGLADPLSPEILDSWHFRMPFSNPAGV